MFQETCYIAANCNHTPTAVDWGKNNLICYASCNSVLIYDPNFGSGGKIISTLVYHKKRINSVRWLRGVDEETEIVAGSSDGETTVWTLCDKKYNFKVLQQHESNVNLVDGLYKGPHKDNAVIVTISMDFTANIWCRCTPADDFNLLQKINFGRSICVGIRLSFLPDDTTILACALDNSNIYLYIEENSNFILSNQLKGHEDWVCGLDFTKTDDSLLLASSSQDLYIRLWKFLKIDSDSNDDTDLIRTKSTKYRIILDSILTGHEGWIYSVNWSSKNLQLLSASLDKSMVIWELDKNSNLWLEKIRVGEVGGNTLGFYGGIFGPNGDCILAHSYHGAFHIWRNTNDGWQPCVTVGGHFGEVTDLAWEPNGEFLLSVSADQTTRIHAPWTKNNQSPSTWHEIARPQIHGYDMSALAILSRYRFASAAEEKVIRTFQAPTNFVENFRRICRISDDSEGDSNCGPKGASVPSLGLSNKAVFNNDDYIDATNDAENLPFNEVTLTEPPTEETLLQNTLWPEVQKLYGHGYEVYSLASSPDGRFLASACKATTPEHAAILLWDTSTWTQSQKLISHTLTVVQIAFSPDSQHLLSVSRDRRWTLFSRNVENQFELSATTDRKTSIHTRIIWCCSWSHDSKYFTTGSRDGKIVVWTRIGTNPEENCLGDYGPASNHLELKNESITALAFAPKLISQNYLIAVGVENGLIQLYNWNLKGWMNILVLKQDVAHHLTVRRLVFRPARDRRQSDEDLLQLASCGDDWAVKIHNFRLN